MPANLKTVVRLDFPYDPVMGARFAREADIELRTCKREGADDNAWVALAEAHVYLVSSAKDELPRQWFATADLLKRCPRLVCVSATGAGYDTIDVEACTRAGIIVVNQAGMNARSVAEHTLGMMLSLSKRLTESDRRLRRERGYAREELMGREISGKVVGLIGIGHVGRRVAQLARAFDMTVLAYDPYVSAEEIARRGATHQRDVRHDRRARLRSHEEGRRLHHHRAWRHPRRGGAVRGVAIGASQRRRRGRLGSGAAAATAPVVDAAQRDRDISHRRCHH
jgi:phosphoglycerate dehydrogenase-like enzyme